MQRAYRVQREQSEIGSWAARLFPRAFSGSGESYSPITTTTPFPSPATSFPSLPRKRSWLQSSWEDPSPRKIP